MSKLFKLFSALLIILTFATPTAFASNDHGKDHGYHHGKDLLVSLGDSIAFGYGLSTDIGTPSKAAFPYLIGDEADLRVRNLAVSGWQTDDLLAALENNKKFRKAVKHADYVTVAVGSNDFLEALRLANVESGGDPVRFEKLLAQKLAQSDVFDNLAEILKEIRSLTDEPIVLYNIYNPFQVNDPVHQFADRFLPQINANYALLADAFHDVELADAAAAFGDKQAKYVIKGDVHPTAAGQKLLAKIGLRALCIETVKH